MIKDITIGQYYPTNSVIHRLDPRTKINATILYIVFLFLVNTVWGYLAAFLFLAVATGISKIPAKYLLKGLKPLIFIIVLTVIINMFWTPGNVLWQWWILKLTDAGLVNAVKMGFRLILLVAGTSLMTLCTPTLDLADGMESMMKKNTAAEIGCARIKHDDEHCASFHSDIDGRDGSHYESTEITWCGF